MAIYRSDQTKVTFAAEAGLGGTPEPVWAIAGSSTNATDLDGAVKPGDKKITVSAVAGVIAVGNFIIIGNNTTATGENTQLAQQEIRRIESVSGTDLYLDRPLGHYHPDAAVVKHVTAFPADYTSNAGYFPALTFIPGVYDTVTLPEPSNTIDPTFYLGFNTKRNFSHAYRGQQSYDGSISSFALLNGWPLRYVFGSVSSDSSTAASSDDLTTTVETAAKKGDVMVIVEEDAAEELETRVAAGDFISITAGSAVTDAATGLRTEAGTDIRQIIKREDTSGDTATFIMHLNMPLSRNYAAGDTVQELIHTDGTTVYTHTITEQNELPSISMQAMFKDTADADANALIRKYYGGYVSSATISAEEGGLVQMSWDSIPFMGMVHNIENAWDATAGTPAEVADIPGYTLTGTPGTNASYDYVGVPVVDGTGFVADDSVAVPNTDGSASTFTSSYPQSDPYYFSQGEITLHGVVVAKIRDFSISVNNNVEPRYYIEKRGDIRRRGPSQLHEGRREYSMTCTVVPDSIEVAKTATAASRTIFEEYLMQGDYGAFGANQGIKGIGLKIEFTRATNDTITLEVTGSTDAGAPNAYIINAPVQVDGNNPIQIPVEIGIRAWTTIQVKDKEPFYP